MENKFKKTILSSYCQEDPAPDTFNFRKSIASKTLKCSGVATNITSYISANVSFEIVPNGDHTYSAKGEYDGKNLFGRFDVSGVELPMSREEVICLQFIGDLDLGCYAPIFRIGTRVSYVMHLAITSNGIKGVYHLGMLPSISYEQYGILELSYSFQEARASDTDMD